MTSLEPGMMVTSNVRLERSLGAGGMGRVWIAEHLSLKTRVVVKFMTEELTKTGEGRVRFEREAAAASQVRSPHVVQTFDHGVMADGVPYIVMELLEGRDLEDLLSAEGAQPPSFVRDMIQQLCRALEKAHQVGIIHRDVKPSNVFLCDAGSGELFVKLLDFGIAKGTGASKVADVTQTGLLMGSPLYMSPEQIVGAKTIDQRSDIWAVGVLAFQALTGRRPFEAETIGALALKIVNEPLPLPSALRPDLPPEVDAWFARACDRKAEQRFQSAKEMSDAFVIALSGQITDRISIPKGIQGVRDALSSSPAAVSRTLANSDTVAVATMPGKGSRKLFAAGAVLAVAVGLGSGLWMRAHSTSVPPADPAQASAGSTAIRPTLPIPTDPLALPALSLQPPVASASGSLPLGPSATATAKTASTAAGKVVRPAPSAVSSASASGAPPVAPPAKTNVDPIL